MMIVGKAGEATGSAYITKHRRLAERVTVQRQLAGARGRFCPTLASPAIRWAAPAGIGGRANTVYQTGTSRLPICDVGVTCRRFRGSRPEPDLALRPFTAYPVTGNVCY
jgi:hypothetical protein